MHWTHSSWSDIWLSLRSHIFPLLMQNLIPCYLSETDKAVKPPSCFLKTRISVQAVSLVQCLKQCSKIGFIPWQQYHLQVIFILSYSVSWHSTANTQFTLETIAAGRVFAMKLWEVMPGVNHRKEKWKMLIKFPPWAETAASLGEWSSDRTRILLCEWVTHLQLLWIT